jgi:hypothetical protein
MITTMTTRVAAVLVLLALAASATACASVQPWQRGRLSKTCMQFSPDPALTAFAGHWQESREGAAGGLGLQGGGCGCK